MTDTTGRHRITIQPLTPVLRQKTGLLADPNPLAVVESSGGCLIRVCTTAADWDTATLRAEAYAAELGATLLAVAR